MITNVDSKNDEKELLQNLKAALDKNKKTFDNIRKIQVLLK